MVDDGAPIAMISHDPDGDWQFLDAVEEGNEDAAVERSIDDLLIVDLHHIIE